MADGKTMQDGLREKKRLMKDFLNEELDCGAGPLDGSVVAIDAWIRTSETRSSGREKGRSD